MQARWCFVDDTEKYEPVISNIIEYAYQNDYRYAAWYQNDGSYRVYFGPMLELLYNGDTFVAKRMVRRDPPTDGK